MSAERFSASSAARHMACHASANLLLAIPNYAPPVVDPDKGAKGVGTARHKMFAEAMELTPRELTLYVKALDYMAELRKRRRFKAVIEETVVAEWTVGKSKTTADIVLHTQDELHVVDFKNGKILVECVGNEQLLFYAASYAHLAPKAKEVHLHIVQPEADNFVEWVVTTLELKQFMVEALEAEKKIRAGDVTFGPSDHCTFCPANPHSRGDKGKPLCPAMMQQLYPKTDMDEDEILGL